MTERAADIVSTLRARIERYHRQQARRAGWARRFIATGLDPLDAALPNGGVPRGAIVEVLSQVPGVGALSLAMRITRACVNDKDEQTRERGEESAPPHGEESATGFTDERTIGQGLKAMSRSRGDGWHGQAVGAGMLDPTLSSSRGRTLAPRGIRTDQPHRVQRPTCVFPRTRNAARPFVFVDTRNDFYPPAIDAYGLSLERLIVVRTGHLRNALWAVEQSLRCPIIGAVIAPLAGLTERDSRRLQLASERTGCVGLILRSAQARGKSFAAVRLLVEGVASDDDRHLCDVHILTVREGMPAGPFRVDLNHETGIGFVPSLALERPVARTG